MKLWFNSYRLWKIDTWKEIFLGEQKKHQKPTLELPIEDKWEDICFGDHKKHQKLTIEVPIEDTWDDRFLVEQTKGPKLTLELPIEIIESEILPRLPAKSLGPCMCVCKQWKSFILTREFVKMNLQHIKSDQSFTHHKLVVVDQYKGTFCSHDCKALNHGSTTIRPTPFKVDPFDGPLILGSLDGLICLAFMKTCELMFWNPFTGSYKKLSSNTNYPHFYELFIDVFGFYFDYSSTDYKLLHVVSNGTLGAYIYSWSLDSWRKIQCLKNHSCISNNLRWSSATFLGESLYFVVRDCSMGGVGRQCWIIVFDVKLEKFRKIQFPPVSSDEYFCGSLVIIKGYIHLCVAYGDGRNESFLEQSKGDLLMMNGDGWIKMAAFAHAPHFSSLNYTELCVMRNGNWLAILEDYNVLFKLDIEDLATNYWAYFWASWLCPLSRTIYVETPVSSNP